MKRLLVTALSFSFAAATYADLVFLEDFEDATVGYTTSDAEYSDGAADYFGRIGGTGGLTVGGTVVINGIQGSGYFGGQDLDAALPAGTGGNATMTVTFGGISISGYTSLIFSGLFAEDDDGTNQDWDQPDGFLIEYQIDGGGYANLLAFEDQNGTNTEPLRDTNFDGVGDGTALTDTLTLYQVNIAGTGSSLDIRMTMSFDSGDEDIAFDNIRIDGTVVPEPSTFALFGVALAGMAMIRRKRS